MKVCLNTLVHCMVSDNSYSVQRTTSHTWTEQHNPSFAYGNVILHAATIIYGTISSVTFELLLQSNLIICKEFLGISDFNGTSASNWVLTGG